MNKEQIAALSDAEKARYFATEAAKAVANGENKAKDFCRYALALAWTGQQALDVTRETIMLDVKATYGSAESGKVVKNAFKRWFSHLAKVAGWHNRFSDDEREALLSGKTAVSTAYMAIMKAEKDIEQAADKAAEPSQPSQPADEPAATPSIVGTINAVTAWLNGMFDAEPCEAETVAMQALIDAVATYQAARSQAIIAQAA